MSEEKLYVVKNDEGKYLYFSNSAFWGPDISDCLTTPNKKQAGLFAFVNGGHVVTLIEEPKKVVLTKEQAEIVDDAHSDETPAGYIFSKSDEEELLMKAYVNGYKIEQAPRYTVYVPGTNNKFLYNKRGDSSTRAAKLKTPIVPSPVTSYQTAYGQYKPLYWFTDAEITKFSLQDCEREEVKDDDNED